MEGRKGTVETRGEILRFWFGNHPTSYVDVYAEHDYRDERLKLIVRGGTMEGITILPRSGNSITVDLLGVKDA